MKRNRNGHSRTVYAILALWLCITLVPFSSFAASVPENGVENGDNAGLILGQEEDGAEALQAEEQYSDEAEDEQSAEPEDTAEPEEQAGEEYQDEIEVQRPAEADADGSLQRGGDTGHRGGIQAPDALLPPVHGGHTEKDQNGAVNGRSRAAMIHRPGLTLSSVTDCFVGLTTSSQ